MESPDTKEPWTLSTFDAKQLATQTRVQQTDRPFWTVLSTEASKKERIDFFAMKSCQNGRSRIVEARFIRFEVSCTFRFRSCFPILSLSPASRSAQREPHRTNRSHEHAHATLFATHLELRQSLICHSDMTSSQKVDSFFLEASVDKTVQNGRSVCCTRV